MLYEYRRYEVVPGKLAALHARFQNVTTLIWQRHGIRPVGFWTADVGVSNVLHYLLEWEDMAERDRKWAAFGADQEWVTKRAASETDGPLVARVTNEFWRPAAYSAMK